MNKEELKSQTLFKEIIALTKKCIPSATDEEAENLVLKVLDIILDNWLREKQLFILFAKLFWSEINTMGKIDFAMRKLEIILDETSALNKDLKKLFTMKSFPARVVWIDIPTNGEDDDRIDVYFHIDLGSREVPLHLYSYCVDLFDTTRYNTLDYHGSINASKYSKIDLARLRIMRAIYELTKQVLSGEVDTEGCVEVLLNPNGTFNWESI